MKRDNKYLKVPLIITGINYATFLIPFLVLFPLLILIVILKNELALDLLGNIIIFIFLFAMLIDVIAMLLSPFIQFVLTIIALLKRKWWLIGVHIVSAFIFCGVITVFFNLFINRP